MWFLEWKDLVDWEQIDAALCADLSGAFLSETGTENGKEKQKYSKEDARRIGAARTIGKSK